MKTTLILPDALVRQAKVRAAETGLTLSALVAQALETSLAAQGAVQEGPVRRAVWANHGFPIPNRKGGRGTDSTKLISDDRDGR
jgi:hypothetical protein